MIPVVLSAQITFAVKLITVMQIKTNGFIKLELIYGNFLIH